MSPAGLELTVQLPASSLPFVLRKPVTQDRTARRTRDRHSSAACRRRSGADLIVDAEHVQHTGVGEKCAGTAAVERAELVNILQDRPELDAVAGHQPHCTFDRLQTAEGGELVE